MHDRKKTWLTALFLGLITAVVLWQSRTSQPSLPEACMGAREQLRQLTLNEAGLASIAASVPEAAMDTALDEHFAGMSGEGCTALSPELNAGLEALAHVPWAAKMPQAASDIKDAIRDCHDRRVNGEFKTHADSAGCSNPAIVKATGGINYPYMDLVGQFVTERMELAKKVDGGSLTDGEDPRDFARLAINLAEEERKRNTMSK